jgi:hypothetical protein
VAATPVNESTTVLTRALRALLRPLVRLLLSRQITYPALTSLLKAVYVEVADEDFELPDKRQTDSRVSLLTGIHRKEVSRLRGETPTEDEAPASVSLGALILAHWVGVAAFQGADNKPMPLSRLAREDGVPSFETLVQSVSKDIRPRAVLDEWLRLGLAHVDENQCVCLNVEAFIPESGFEEKAYYFGRNIRDHIAAGAHNLEGGGDPFIDRSVYYSQLTEASTRELAELAERVGMDAMHAVNRRAIELQERDAGENHEPPRRMNFGVYFYETDYSPEADDAPDEGGGDGA